MVSYDGTHYKLISYKNKKSFDTLPDLVKEKIKSTCSKNGKLVGTYGKIKDF